LKRSSDDRSYLTRRASKGFRGYPLATIAFYGPDDRLATKVAVGIMAQEDKLLEMKRWFSQGRDIRYDPGVNREIVAFVEKYHVKSVAMVDRIIGCPHEEGIDYPEGETCPECRFWAYRDRWTGEIIH
jgi:hypothetical protein